MTCTMSFRGWWGTYEFGNASSCEATVGGEITLGCEFDGRLGLVVEDLAVLVRYLGRKRR